MSFGCLCYYLWTYFTTYSSFSIVDFQQVNGHWENRNKKNSNELICISLSYCDQFLSHITYSMFISIVLIIHLLFLVLLVHFSDKPDLVFKISSRRFQDVLRMSCRNFFNTPSRRLEDILRTSSRHLQDIFKTSWRCLEEGSARHPEDVLKTSWRHKTKTKEDVFKAFSRRIIKLNCPSKHVLKTFSRHSQHVSET